MAETESKSKISLRKRETIGFLFIVAVFAFGSLFLMQERAASSAAANATTAECKLVVQRPTSAGSIGFWVGTECAQVEKHCREAFDIGLFCGWSEPDKACICEVSTISNTPLGNMTA